MRGLAFILVTAVLVGAGCADGFGVSNLPQTTEEVRVVASSTSEKGGRQEYLIDLRSGARTVVEEEPAVNWSGFIGIAPDVESDAVSTAYYPVYDPFETRAIVRATSYDVSNGESDFGGYPVLTSADYLCDIASRTCEPTAILSDAEAAAKPSVHFYRWDPDTRRVFGNPAGEGAGDMNVAYVYDYDTGTLTKSPDRAGAYVPSAYDSSFGRVAIFSDDSATAELLVYDTSDFSRSERAVSLDAFASDDQVKQIAWSPDDSMIIVDTVKRIYAVNPDAGTVSLLVEDVTLKREALSYKTGFVFSSNGGLLAYVDRRDSEDVLVAVDVASGETSEVARDAYLFILGSM